MIWPSCRRRMIGMTSTSGSLDMMTPAAWTPHWRFRPSRPSAVATTSCAWGSSSWTTRKSGLVVALGVGLEDVGERHALAHDVGWHRLGELLAHRERVPEHATRVLEGLLRLDGAVGDDLGDALLAVLLGDLRILLTTTALVGIDVECGHRNTP